MPSSRSAAKKSPPGGKRTTAAEVQRRLRFVEDCLSKGMARQTIVTLCRSNFNMPPRTTDDYLRRVKEAWQEVAKQSRPERLQQTRARLMLLRETLFEANAWAALMNLEKILVDVDGLRSPEPNHWENHEVSAGAFEDASDEEIYNEIIKAADSIKDARKQGIITSH